MKNQTPFAVNVEPVELPSFMRLARSEEQVEPFIVPIGEFRYRITTGRTPGINHAAGIITLPLASRDLTRAVADAVCQAWRERIELYANALLAKWNAFELAADALADPDFEPSEDGGPEFFAAFESLVRMGLKFDPGFAVLMKSWKNEAPIDFTSADYFQSHISPPHVVAWYRQTKKRESESFVDGGEDVADMEGHDPDEDGTDEQGAANSAMLASQGAADFTASQLRNRQHGQNVKGMVKPAAADAGGPPVSFVDSKRKFLDEQIVDRKNGANLPRIAAKRGTR